MPSNFTEKITKVYTALINRINASINTHNSSNSAHTDIRESIPEDTSDVTETSSLGRIGTNANATQHEINVAINNLINASGEGNISNLIGGVDYYIDSETGELVLEYTEGKLIRSISKSSSGNVDTYTILFTDLTTYEFTVTNGTGSSGGSSVVVDSSWIANSTNPIQSKLIKTALDSKADTNNVYTKTEIDSIIGDIEEDMLS